MSQLTDFFDGIRGVPFPYFGLVAPTGFLLCDGSAVSRTTYAVLFGIMSMTKTGNTTSGSAVIGSIASTANVAVGMPLSGPGIPAGATVLSFVANTSITMSANATATATGVAIVVAPYGVGDGSTTFNIPDCRGRAFSGRDDMGGIAANRLTTSGSSINGVTLGMAGGAENQTLALAQIPAHNHGVTDAGHNHTLTDPGHVHTLTDPGHTHNTQSNLYPLANQGSGTGTPYNGAGSFIGSSAIVATTTGITMAAKVTSITANATTTGITTQNNGSGNAHPNVQPTMIVNYIVKT